MPVRSGVSVSVRYAKRLDTGVARGGKEPLPRVLCSERIWHASATARVSGEEHGSHHLPQSMEGGRQRTYRMSSDVIGHRNEDGKPVLDYPTGSLFVRYMFNKMKLVDPFSTFFVSFDKYFFLVGRARFLDLVGALVFHLPFFLRTIKEARFFELEGTENIHTSHEKSLAECAQKSGIELEKLKQIDQLEC